MPFHRPSRPAGLRRFVEGCALALTCVAAMEATMRLEDWVRFGIPPLAAAADQSDLMVLDEDGLHGRPHARYREFALNNHGFRGPDIAVQPAPGTLRIVTTGASETFGLRETPGREYPRQLEDSLRAALPSGPPVEVVNAALPGMTLPTLATDLERRLARFAPRVVTIYPVPVQYLEDPVPADPPPAGARPAPRADADRGWSPRLRMRRRLIDQAKAVLPVGVQDRLRARLIARATEGMPADSLFTSIPADRLARFDRHLRQVVGRVRAIGAEPVLMTRVSRFTGGPESDPSWAVAWRKFYPRATEATIIAFDRAGSRVICEVARDSAVALARPDRAFGADRARWMADFSHFNDTGAAVVAGALARAVQGTLAGASTGLDAPCPMP